MMSAAVHEKFSAPDGLPSIGLKYSEKPESLTISIVVSRSASAWSINPNRRNPFIISQFVLTQLGPCQ